MGIRPFASTTTKTRKRRLSISRTNLLPESKRNGKLNFDFLGL